VLLLPLPRDPWPDLRNQRATRFALTAVYVLVLLAAVAEVARSLVRVKLVVFHGYVTLGQVALLPYSDPYSLHMNTWPPFFLLVASVLALVARVSEPLALALWQVAGVLAIWGCCKLAAEWYLDPEERVTFWPIWADRVAFGSSAVLVPFLMTARLFQEQLQHTQINAQMLFLILLAFHRFRRGRAAVGGSALALAISLKALPVVLLPYLVYRRAWRALAWTGVSLVILNAALPALVYGPERSIAHWRSWRAVAAREVNDPVPEFRNQSLLAAMKRLLTTAGGARDPLRYAIADWPPRAVRGALYALVGLVGMWLAWRFRHHPANWTDPRTTAELAILLGAMVIADPLAWKAHYVVLIMPYTFAWWALRRLPHDAPGRSWRWALWWGSFLCITLSAPAFLGGHARDVLESLNVILVGALLLLVLAVSLVDRSASPGVRVPSAST
jgi:glycosyl transferase family 87